MYIISTDKGFILTSSKLLADWDTAPFIKNTEVIPKLLGGDPQYRNFPYSCDLSGYDVSEPVEVVRTLNGRVVDDGPVMFVTLTPKAVETKQEYELIKRFNKCAELERGITLHSDEIKELLTLLVVEKSEATESQEEFVKDLLFDFKRWYDRLTPADKCTVHPPAGSGGSHGLYNMSEGEIVNRFLFTRKVE